MMACHYLGQQVGDLINICCDGQETRKPLHACLSPEVKEEYTIATLESRGFAPLEINGKRLCLSVAGCVHCPFNIAGSKRVV